MALEPDRPDIAREQGILDAWGQWSELELPNRRRVADRAYKRALAAGEEAAWQHAEIMERSYGQLSDMIRHQDPYFARIRGRMKDIDGQAFDVDLRVHRYHRSETFPQSGGQEVLDISHLAPLADLVRNPQLSLLTVTLSDRELLQWAGNNPNITVLESTVEDIELENGHVVRVAPRYGAIFEDRIRRRLQQSAMPALDVLADVLDQKQNAIVGDRSPQLMLLVLDGPAGTGKTVVAAHRIAVAEPPDSPGLYLTPTPTLRDYISPVLPRLGLERSRARAMSVGDLAVAMWPDLPWAEDLSKMVEDSPFSAKEWTTAFETARSNTTSWTAVYREACRLLGADVPSRFGTQDVVPLLWMGCWSRRPRPNPAPQWIIVDEAQALPLLAFQSLAGWLGPKLSWIIAGDLMQQGTRHEWDGWSHIQTALGLPAKNTAILWLSRSYRVPPKIHAAAEQLRHAINPQAQASESVPWHPHAGEVGIRLSPSREAEFTLADDLVQECHRQRMTAVAILVPDEEYLAGWSSLVKTWSTECQVLDGRSPYRGGLALTTLDFVRGLEFDAVILVDCDEVAYPDTPVGARQLYTSLTRARRAAYLLVAGNSSPWLSRIGDSSARPLKPRQCDGP